MTIIRIKRQSKLINLTVMLITFNGKAMVLVILSHLSNAERKKKKGFLSSDHKMEKCH